MGACVYVLKFVESGKFYVGSTIDIKRRLNQHRTGHASSTIRPGNTFKLVFQQDFATLSEARFAERKIKSWKRKDFIEKIIEDGFVKRP